MTGFSMRVAGIGIIAGCIGLAGSSQAAFVAYNDANFQSGDPGGNITTNNFFSPSNGVLLDYSSGLSVGVVVTLGPSTGAGFHQYNNTTNPPPGSDAYTVFQGKVGTTNYQVMSTGASNLGPYTIRFTGLNSNAAYSFVYVGTRGFNSQNYLDRIISMTVLDVDLFTNNSTSGGTNFARYQANDSNERAGGNVNGEVWRYDGLKSGVDGDMQFDLYARGTNGQAANIYFGAFMLQGFDGTNPATIPSGPAYWKGLSAPAGGETAWRTRTYVPTNWIEGAAPYYYGDVTNGTLLTDMQNSYYTLYARLPFVVTNLTVQELTLIMDYDDAFTAWIDGSQVATSATAPSNPTYTNYATGSHESSIGTPPNPTETFHITGAPLVLGTNYLCIQGFNFGIGSSDFVLSPAITAVYGSAGGGITNRLKIMCIGDSITQSTTNYASYRYWLWKLLTVSNNYDVDFIGANTNARDGSAAGGPNLYADFDRDHAGYWGWAAYEVDAALHTNGPYYAGGLWGPSDAGGILQTNNYYSNNIPDIALIHLGHNDVFDGWKALGPGITNATNSISILIDHLRQRNTNLVILLAQNIPLNPALNDATSVVDVIQLGNAIPTLATSKYLVNSPVIPVDHRTGFDPTNDTWASDGTHPTESGEKKMAAKWFTALQSWLPNLVVTNDADLNGMADGWEVYHFGRYGQNASADPDGDGMDNRDEYIIGSSPTAESLPPAFRDSVTPGGFTFDTASQRVYDVDIRTDLVSGAWQVYTNFTGDGSTRSISPTNSSLPDAYYRFRIRLGP